MEKMKMRFGAAHTPRRNYGEIPIIAAMRESVKYISLFVFALMSCYHRTTNVRLE
jgi:hypothetical protein